MIDEEDGVDKENRIRTCFIELHSITQCNPVDRFENEVLHVFVYSAGTRVKQKILVEFGTNQYKFTSNNIYDKGV